MNKKSLVISLGGSVVVPETSSVNLKLLKAFQKLVLSLEKRYHKIFIIVGGGSFCRLYQNAARTLNKEVTDKELDTIGLHITRDNGRLIRSMFGKKAYPELVTDPFTKINFKQKILVSAGVRPGQTTDTSAVQIAETYGVDEILNLSNIVHVYNKDPRKHKDAIPLEELNWKEMRELVGDKQLPGMNTPFDPIATKLAKKLGLRVVFLEGTNMPNIKKYLENKNFVGTIVE